jgi:two-component system, NtrC family, nitrogen regulation sensor histidine kinase NtrY
LQRYFFTGYWTRYDLQVTVCQPDDSLYLQPPDDEFRHCYTFFDEMILQQGIEIPGSDFHFLDNLNGRISYLASIPFFPAGRERRVFIELDSRILSEGLGYPELLLDEGSSSFTGSMFSYAKYNERKLITRDGEYPYRRTSGFYTSGDGTFEQVTIEGYDHMIYNVDEKNTIIVGSRAITPVDSLISFSYIFAFNFLLFSVFFLLSTVRLNRPAFNWNFKNRILYSMAAILFFTFLLICSGTVYFIVQQYRSEQNDNLRNTMRSVTIELIHKVEYEDHLQNWSSEDYHNLDELLRKFSNVFYTDINLYDASGDLLATSRPEIFDRQLLSRRMNRLVYEQLASESASEYIHNEHIGQMRYISAYVPLLNSENEFLAYLNLPYFTQSGELAKDITNLVVAVINIYMILLLVVLVFSVILADRITQPLRMIQSRIARLSLSRKNEKIRYERRDEIRGLVEEYNYMVEELERSAVLLAQSERETAWREMAKQIAHEIKNPLTPMKLNVQHLQRTLDKGTSDPDMVHRISATLIEQIDSLSAIANEFSDFAKMPRARNEKINLITKLKNLVQLFEGSERAEIELETGLNPQIQVYADKEQLMRVFINLVKNGLQSIPEGRTGRIRISVDTEQDRQVTISFRDNGKGIPEEIRDRLFQPNFTTKSGGMGMGLAISNNIIRSLGGRIWYETEMEKGTTFFVKLPLMVEKT